MEKHFEWLGTKEKSKKLSKSTAAVFDMIEKKWPTNPLEVAYSFTDKGDQKSLSARYLYHFKKLYNMKLIRMKKIGNTYVAWPTEVEKLRIMKEVFKGA